MILDGEGVVPQNYGMLASGKHIDTDSLRYSQRESQESAGEGIGRVDYQHALVDYFTVLVERNVTSWAPPSTMEVAETSVSLASRCRSGMVITPQLHIVDLTL